MQRALRIFIVILGIIAGQAILFWPSLTGRKILLPLDNLSIGTVYLPRTDAVKQMVPFDHTLIDLVSHYEPQRVFAANELRAGRWPMWVPYGYAGAPLIWPKYSPFNLLAISTPSPKILPWVQMLEAIVAGVGAYAFFRRALSVNFWPATIIAWCYPLTAFFIFWQGFSTGASVYWMGWMMLAVDRAVRNPRTITAISLAIATCLVLISGNIDVAAQVLLVSGLYAIVCLVHARAAQRGIAKPIFILAAGWLLGIMLATPHVLPLVEYVRTGTRFAQRQSGTEERPPIGLSELPRIALPDFYGTSHVPSLTLSDHNQIESAASAYCGVIATLFLAPLAWTSKRRRWFVFTALAITLISLSWTLNLPGFTAALRLPVLKVLSHNRLVFASAFFVLCLAALGLDAIVRGEFKFLPAFGIFALLFAGLGGWCFYLAGNLPAFVAVDLPVKINSGFAVNWVRTADDVQRVQQWFARSLEIAGVLCGIGLAAWTALWLTQNRPRWIVLAMAILLPAELLCFAHDRRPQCDTSLYYPPIETLDRIARAAPGRVVGYFCLTANVWAMSGLNSVAGYDAIDPAEIVAILDRVAAPKSSKLRYARVQSFSPAFKALLPDGVNAPPALSMLGVRYFVFRGNPPKGVDPIFSSTDYFALENRSAMPRVWIPRRVNSSQSADAILDAVTSPSFMPGDVAFVDEPIDLPANCDGEAHIESETPTQISVALEMNTAGLVVLADRWDAGWRAYLNGQRVPIYRTNYAVRGVVAPAGKSTLEFRYFPKTLAMGLTLAGCAVAIMIGWLLGGVVVERLRISRRTV